MLSPLRSLLDVAELANQSHSLLVLLVFVWCFFVFCLWLLCFVSVHASATFEPFFNCLRQCFKSIHLSGNMQLNVLNDLAKAKRRCGKKDGWPFGSNKTLISAHARTMALSKEFLS